MAYQDILYETDGRLAVITLNRPDKLNALSNRLRGELFYALKDAEADPEVGVIILRGAGRAFSSGYDLAGGAGAGRPGTDSPYLDPRTGLPPTPTTRPGPQQWSTHVLDVNWALWELAKPVVAQVHGYCLAGGSELASMCDFRIVAEDAVIGYPPVRAMTTMDIMWAPWHLPMARAREFAYLGDQLSGAEAARLGWANRAVPADQLAAAAEAFARRLANIDNDMLMYSKRAVNRAYEVMGIRTALYAGADIQALSAYRPVNREFQRIAREQGLKAALEWRDAKFGDYRGAGRGEGAQG